MASGTATPDSFINKNAPKGQTEAMVDDNARDMQRVLDLIPHQRDQIKDLTDQVEKLTRDAAKAKQDNERVVADWERKLLDAKSAADHQATALQKELSQTKESEDALKKQVEKATSDNKALTAEVDEKDRAAQHTQDKLNAFMGIMIAQRLFQGGGGGGSYKVDDLDVVSKTMESTKLFEMQAAVKELKLVKGVLKEAAFVQGETDELPSSKLVDLKTVIIEHRDAVAAGDALHVDSQIIGQGSMLKALCVLAKEKFEKDEALERALLAKTELGGFKEQASEYHRKIEVLTAEANVAAERLRVLELEKHAAEELAKVEKLECETIKKQMGEVELELKEIQKSSKFMDRELLKYIQMSKEIEQYTAKATGGGAGGGGGSASLPDLGASHGGSPTPPPAGPPKPLFPAVGQPIGPAVDVAGGERHTAKARPAGKPASAKKGGKISLSQLNQVAAA